MATFSNPENALKRAEELINVGQKQEALQVLHGVITSKRHRSWNKTLESIMKKFIELCVELQMGRFAKDVLFQFRNVCQQVNVSSLEEVIKYFLHLSTEKARNQTHALEEALDVDDLEAEKNPEDLMLSYASTEQGKKERSWLKFLWETFRTVLDILKNNSKLEALYSMTAHKAFQFCKQYKRKTEFRRLCEIIRNHLANLIKYTDQRDRPDLSSPESFQLCLDTRFEQLKTATELQLWQEAFRSIEDIHGLMCMVKKKAKPSLMVVYYAKLTDIFWVSDNHLYHAYAWLKLFSLQKKFNKNLSQKDLQLVASSVVLTALSVTLYDYTQGTSHVQVENEKARNLRMAQLIKFDESGELLSRSYLLSELVSNGVMSCAIQEVKDLYNLFQHEFLHTDILSKVQALLNKISKIGGKFSSVICIPEVKLSQYVPAMEKLATLKLLKQVSQVYQSIKVDSLSGMIPFFEFSVVEKILVEAVKHSFISMKIDHDKGVILVNNLGLESDLMRDHFIKFAGCLNNAMDLIHPPAKKALKLDETLPAIVEKEHKRLLARKEIIEKRKEEQERQLLHVDREEEAKKQKAEQITKEAEQKRLLSESEERKKKLLLKAKQEQQDENQKALHQEKEKLIKKLQEKERKIQKMVKTNDYLERAKREESIPLIEVAFQQRLDAEKVLHEQEQQREIELSRLRHGDELKQKNRLARMLDYKKIFQDKVVNRHQAMLNRLKLEKEERLKQNIKARTEERVIRRKYLFYLKSEEERQTKLREEEEARKRKSQEEEEARKREEAERRKKEEAEQRAIAEKQRQRELEVEEKEKQRREALLGKSTEPKADPSVAPYVPKWKRQSGGSGQGAPPPPAEADRWGRRQDDRSGQAAPPPLVEAERWGRRQDDRSGQGAPPPQAEADRWGKRQDDRASQFGSRWRKDDRRSDFGSGSKSSTWSSSKIR